MRTNYVLIDFESVQPEQLELLAKDHFKVMVFVGSNQTKLKYETVAALQALGARAQYVKISGVGPNALDFHIAFYVGQCAACDSAGFFHIVSKDKGFDPLIQHLKLRKAFAARVEDIRDIPLVRNENAKSPSERMEAVLAKLEQLKQSPPSTVAKLNSMIAALFQKQLGEDEVGQIVQSLARAGHLAVTGTKVSYALQNP